MINLISFSLILLSTLSFSSAYHIVTPATVRQGDPLHVFILGEDSGKIIQIQFKGEKVWPFILEHKPHAIFGIGLNEKPGIQTIYFTDITSSSTITRNVEVVTRAKPVTEFSIPATLGGNTKQGEQRVTEGIATENEVLNILPSHIGRLWKERFGYPLAKNTVTDTYGYTRVTGKTTVLHKGVDFKAPVGTPVYAMNRGVVRLVRHFSVYGNTVVIDHGEGIMTFYMHLSTAVVDQGKVIEKGTLIGYSGKTGYANGPHLHVSVKVSKQSVDPLLFMRYVGSR
jgi:murein DD-endopeptidase MepM/ murein hydrolase activator NlpD